MPTRYGDFRVAVYRVGDVEAVAVIRAFDADDAPLVRMHSSCVTGDTLGSLRCDCGDQLDAALSLIGRTGGVLLYLAQEGRGIGIANKVRAYSLQDRGLDTVDANLALGLPIDAREYRTAAAILRALSIARVRLLTNNPDKQHALEREGIIVADRVPLEARANPINLRYLETKATRMGHAILGRGEHEAAG
jgi:3,4-dihydroxy 2-butanone 4-phosphate synthase/GTP cyclohydrolase II